MADKKRHDEPLTSNNSGCYNPGPINETDLPTAELSYVQAQRLDVQTEEFPEGPYGSPTNEEKLGKTSPWLPDQAVVNRFRDSNPVSSNRKVPLDEREFDAPEGTIEGQN